MEKEEPPFPWDIIPWWQCLIAGLIGISVLCMYIYFLYTTKPGDYILVGFLVGLMLSVTIAGSFLMLLNNGHPEMQKYHKEYQAHKTYIRRFHIALAQIREEDKASQEIRIEKKIKEL